MRNCKRCKNHIELKHKTYCNECLEYKKHHCSATLPDGSNCGNEKKSNLHYCNECSINKSKINKAIKLKNNFDKVYKDINVFIFNIKEKGFLDFIDINDMIELYNKLEDNKIIKTDTKKFIEPNDIWKTLIKINTDTIKN